MIELGKKQELFVDHKTDFGVYLSDSNMPDQEKECILLPRRQVPAGIRQGDKIEVFVYKDSSDRPIATTQTPAMELGEIALLNVVQVTKIGAFMYWGLEKDLLLPFSEQTVKVEKGDKYLVALYLDKSERLCATMKIYDYLRTDSPYKQDDEVTGTVFSINPRFGAFVAVDQTYIGLIPMNEMVRKLNISDEVRARVTSVREDGKMNLSLRQKAYLQMDVDAGRIMEKLTANEGFLPYHDKSAPADIRKEFGMSKNEFKRAIGRLYKLHKIRITDNGIEEVDEG